MSFVSDKKSMYQILRSGGFGNTVRTWSSYEDLASSDYRGPLGIRSLVPGGPFLAHRPFGDYGPGIYSEMQCDNYILLQGEIFRSTDGLYLFASKLPVPMRPALQDGGKSYHRLTAQMQLQSALWPSDYDALQDLLSLYPDSIIEFSAYSIAVGIVPCRNTLIWEVRNY